MRTITTASERGISVELHDHTHGVERQTSGRLHSSGFHVYSVTADDLATRHDVSIHVDPIDDYSDTPWITADDEGTGDAPATRLRISGRCGDVRADVVLYGISLADIAAAVSAGAGRAAV